MSEEAKRLEVAYVIWLSFSGLANCSVGRVDSGIEVIFLTAKARTWNATLE
jgi:hypothetical protein